MDDSRLVSVEFVVDISTFDVDVAVSAADSASSSVASEPPTRPIVVA